MIIAWDKEARDYAEENGIKKRHKSGKGMWSEAYFNTEAERNAYAKGIDDGAGWDSPEWWAKDDIIPGEDYTITQSWSVIDVLEQGLHDGVVLTLAQAREILDIIDKRHDASIGVNWDVISCHIDMYLQNH